MGLLLSACPILVLPPVIYSIVPTTSLAIYLETSLPLIVPTSHYAIAALFNATLVCAMCVYHISVCCVPYHLWP